MIIKSFLMNILDSIPEPILVADTNHITIYMNKTAVEHYSEGKSLIDKSLLDCHNEESKIQMIEILNQMKSGLEEKKISTSENGDIFMRSIRNNSGQLLGYYERYSAYHPSDAAE
ncbi:MAG: PAS domain-containing protein [Candidatus Neomarinimicrobiota bacterium]